MNTWHKTQDKFPPADEVVEITHPLFRGTRMGKMDPIRHSGWMLTDCTHPAQNCYVPTAESAWRSLSNNAAGEPRPPANP